MALIKWLKQVIKTIGRGVAWVSLVMTFCTVVVVVLRYGFDVGAIPLQEAVVYMHGLLIMLGLSYTLQQDAHVRVDLLYSRFRVESRDTVNLVGHLIFMTPLCLLMALSSLDYVGTSWRILERSSEVGGLPGIFLLKTSIPVAAVLLLLQSVLEVVTLTNKKLELNG